ncbi:MAG: T9SS type A sorting domain-containing protein [Flavobacteriaceae bacterium]|jgi:ligand-binding sensor domain-containing protein|nr:T9SS type A sorting domain-containing protein [Flavobacteriaceae bacterium]
MKRLFALFVVLLSYVATAQTGWQTYFSYREIVAIDKGKQEIFAATPNNVLIYNTVNGAMEYYNTLHGLQTQNITSIHYSENFKKIVVGNLDGSIQLIDRKTKKVINLTAIRDKKSLQEEEKRINCFVEYKGNLYIATNFGITTLNLNNNSFGDSFYLGVSGKSHPIIDLALQGSDIYAVTKENGIKKGALNNPNLVNYTQWQTVIDGKWQCITVVNDQLWMAQNTSTAQQKESKLYLWDNASTTIIEKGTFAEDIIRLQEGENNLLAVFANSSLAISTTGDLLYKIDFGDQTDAALKGNYIYISSNKNGLVQYNIATKTTTDLTPEGPETNRIFSLLSVPEGMWFIAGGYDKTYYNPNIPFLGTYGMSFLNRKKRWENLPLHNLSYVPALTYAAVNPRNTNELYVSSYHAGLLKVNVDYAHLANSTSIVYDETNTAPNGLNSYIPPDTDYYTTRISGVVFDNDGALWVTNNFVPSSLKTMNNTQEWKSYNFTTSFPDYSSMSYGRLVIDKNGTKWVPTPWNGLIAFNEKKGERKAFINVENNLPTYNVTSIALDQNKQLWIGTTGGLRYIPNTDRFLQTTNLQANAIITNHNDLAEELLYQQTITHIKVDGANRKWIAVADAGVFLFSPNGQETIYHFTKENSPLPSNNIGFIEIDENSGEVYFATLSGVVSFRGDSTEGKEDLSSAFVYPNPVHPDYKGDVKISGLMDKANVKITDIEGNLVFETTSTGGTVTWNTYGFNGRMVSSGVYLVLISNSESNQKTVKKLMIIR